MATRNISIRLSLQDQETVKRGLEKLGAEGQAALKKIEAGSAPASKGLLALNDASIALRGSMVGLGIGAAATGFAVLAKRSIDAADAMNDLHLKTGLAFKELAAFDLIARKSGTTVDGVADSIKFLQRYMIEHGDKLRAIGVTATDTNAAMAQFADIVAGVQDPALRTALAMEVLGRGGANMIPVLMGGSEALRQAAEASDRYGSALEKSGPMADEFNDLVAESESTIKALREEILVLLLPVMKDFLQYFKDGAQGVDDLSSAAASGADALKGIGQVLAYMALGAETAARSIMLLGTALSLRLTGHWDLANQANIDYGKSIAAASERTNKFIEILNRERPAVEAVTNEVKGGAKAYDEHTKAYENNLKAILEGEEAAKKAAKEAAAALKEEKDLIFRIRGLLEKDLEDAEKKAALLPDYIRGLEEELRLSGLTAEARAEELALIEASKLAVNGLTEADEARIRALVRAKAEQASGIEAAQKAAEDSARAWERGTDRLKDSITDSIFRGFEDGESAAKIFFDTVKRTLLTSAIQIPVNFLVDTGAGLLRSALGQGGGSGGGPGALGMAGNAASLGNFLSGGSLTAGISAKLFGTGAVGAMGPQIPTSGLLGSGGFSGAFGGALPYAGAAIAAVGILRGLGVIGPGKSVGPNAGGQLIESNGVFSVGPTGADNGGSTAGVIQELSSAVEVLNALASGIGVAQIGSGLASYIDTFKAGGIGNAADLIKDAISKGVIEGLTEAERALISSSGDVGATAARIIENRLLPGQIAARLKQLKDPTGFELDQLKIEEDALIAQAQTLTSGMEQTIADIREIFSISRSKIGGGLDGIAGDWNALGDSASNAARQASAANDNFNTLADALGRIDSASQSAIAGLQATADSLKAFLTGLDSGPLSFLNINQQYAAAKSAYAANANPETARTLLELSKQRDPGIGFARDSAQVRQRFGNTVAETPGLIAAEQQRAAEAIQAERDRARTLNGDQIRSITQSIMGTGREDVIAPWQEILRTGGEMGGKIVPQGFYRAAFPDLFPGFASGGIHSGGLRIVGERGPELEWTPPSRIYSNSQSMAMLDNSAVVSELQAVKSRLDRLDAALVSIAVKTTDQEARQRKWDQQGMPPVRAA